VPGNAALPKETTNWEVKPHPKYPNDRRKDQWKAKPNGGYQTKPNGSPPPELQVVNVWMQDMNEWGTMMYEAIIDLRQRVDELERKGGRRKKASITFK
jgi:hypothetical protein